MKKLLLFIGGIVVANCANAQILLSQPVASEELSEAVIDKVKDDNKQLCALVSVDVSGLTLEQLLGLRLDTDNGSNIYIKNQPTEATDFRFYISPTATFIEVALKGYEKVRLQLHQELKGGKLYKMKLHARPLEVEINIISSVYKEAEVYIDNDFIGHTPLTTIVKYGVPIDIKVVGDIAETKEHVIVTEESEKAFDFTNIVGSKDLVLNISHNAEVKVDESIIGTAKGGVPFIVKDLVYGRHLIVVRALDFNNTQERPINVAEKSVNYLDIQLQHTKTVTIDANVSGAQVSIDGKYLGDTKLTTNLAYGKHSMTMSNAGKSKTGVILVNEKNSYFKWKLPKPSTRYHRGYKTRDIELRPIGLELGYVQKQWIYKAEGEKLKTGFWGQGEKYLHGFQAGISVEPHIGWWFYVHTGLYYEFYYSKRDEEYVDGYNIFGKFMEHSLYVPAHIEFKLPVSDNFYFFVNGGIGFDCGIVATMDYYDVGSDEPYYTEENIYGNSEMGDLKRFNISGEFGGGFCVKRWKFGCTVSRGLLNMSLGEGYKVQQNKLSAYFSYMF